MSGTNGQFCASQELKNRQIERFQFLWNADLAGRFLGKVNKTICLKLKLAGQQHPRKLREKLLILGRGWLKGWRRRLG